MNFFKKNKYLYVYFLMGRILAVTILLFFFCFFFIGGLGRVNGISMVPSFKSGEVFVVNKLIFLIRPPHRYEVVQFVDLKQKKLLMKRVIGLPGDRIRIKAGSAFLAVGKKWEQIDHEEYLPPVLAVSMADKMENFVYNVPENSYFLLGDNRPVSIDSRYFGVVSRDKIVGKILE